MRLFTARRSKKGGLADIVQIMLILLIFGIILLIGGKFVFDLDDNFQNSDVINDQGKTASGEIKNLFGNTMDGAFLFLLIGLCMVALILAMLVAVHPVFLFIYFLFLPVIIFLGAVFSNIYQEMADQPEMVEVASELIFTSHVLEYLPVIVGIFGFILAIVLYRTHQYRI